MIKASQLPTTPSVKLKHLNYIFFFLQIHSFLLHKTLSDGLESSGFLVDYCDVFYQLFGLSF